MSTAGDYVLDLVRRHDRDRFVTALFAPAREREDLLALYAFNLELARIPTAVSEPMLGQIRFQWWRDLVASIAAGQAPPVGHPISEALAPIIHAHGAADVTALIDAREIELEHGGAAAIEPTSHALGNLALLVLGVSDAASRTAGRDAALSLAYAGRAAEEAYVHLTAARAQRHAVDRRALPVLLWATVAEARLRRPAGAAPVLRLTWNAWWGRY